MDAVAPAAPASRLSARLALLPRRTRAVENEQAEPEAAEADAAQGRFWEMHDTLYESQRRLRDKHLRSYAERLQLDVERFARELAEHVHAPWVHEVFMSGVRSGVNGTPTFFINGVRHDDSYETEVLLDAFERAAAVSPRIDSIRRNR